MTRALRLPQSRRSRVWICVLVAAALVLSVVFLVRWQRSVGHRADEIADSFRDMPGVAAVGVTGDGNAPRDLTVHLAADSRRLQLTDVRDRVANLPSELVDDVTITIGAVSAEVDSGDAPAVDLLWALRGLKHATVEVIGRSSQVSVDAGKAPALTVAREVVAALDVRGFQRVDLRVSGAHRTTVDLADDVSVPAGHAMLDEVAPVATYISDASLWNSGIRLELAPGASGRMTTVAPIAQRAARRVRSYDQVADVSFTVGSTSDSTSMTGGPDTDLKASLGVRKALTKKGWTVRGINIDLSGIGIEKQGATAADLPLLRRDLEDLQPSLPADTVVTLSDPDQDRLKVFSGTTPQLRRVAPSLVAMERAGYRIYWELNPPATDISVLLPKGTSLGPESIRAVGGRLRALRWSGSAAIVIQQRKKESEDSYFPSYIAFSSTDEGLATAMRTEPQDSAAVTTGDATRAWNTSAKK